MQVEEYVTGKEKYCCMERCTGNGMARKGLEDRKMGSAFCNMEL